jgi:hypothetical protein
MDKEPARFRVAPLPKPDFRKTEEQAKELAVLYRQVLFAEQRRPLAVPHEQTSA